MSGSEGRPADGSGMDPSQPLSGDAGAAPDKPEMWSRERVVTGWAQLWNVPNMLTLIRILLIPVFWVLLMHEDGQSTSARLWATAIFVPPFLLRTSSKASYLARRPASSPEHFHSRANLGMSRW